MCKECFVCHYGQYLNTATNKVFCELLHKDVVNSSAEDCEEFIPRIDLDGDKDIEIISEYYVHHKCPFCGNEDTLYDADAEGCEIIECRKCGKKYSIDWSIY